MPMPSKELRAKLAKLLPELQQLHGRQDKIIAERLCDVAEEISGVPIGVLPATCQSNPTEPMKLFKKTSPRGAIRVGLRANSAIILRHLVRA
jgi:hypothetical protein